MLTADLQEVERFRALRARTGGEDATAAVQELRQLAREVRLSDLEMITRAQLGHIGGDYSVTDVLVTLYGAVLNVDPVEPTMPERDRFILSKGHSAGALYATLAHCGFFSLKSVVVGGRPVPG